MTQIGNIVGGAQVANLRPSDNKQESTSIDRFSPPQSSQPVSAGRTDVQKQIEAREVEQSQKKGPLEQAAEKLQEFIPEGKIAPNTRLSIDQDDSGLFVYKNVDNDSGEVVRQFPSEEILKFLSYYREAEGIVVDDEA